MCYVYILQSSVDSKKVYVGLSNDVQRRIREHNTQPTCAYTRSYRPWMLKIYIAFNNRPSAARFESYLKSHSGRAFLRKRLLQTDL
ncbi:MAG: GIY-YIG nuclease family protein [Candidatus Omnitrophica bacterium]|nr:GIY-YIG nuclease family protein [Candidatus Omnitrophota bacterium]